MREFILRAKYPQMGNSEIFVCGQDPRMPSYDADIGRAVRFSSADDAKAHRNAMPYELGGTHKYRVCEILPGGTVVDAES